MIDRNDPIAAGRLNPIRVIGFFAENVKMLRVADFTPKPHVNRITGANGSGKSSLIESLAYALTSAKSHPSHLIRHGEDRTFIRLQLGDGNHAEFTAIRRATADGETTLSLEAESGAVLSKPQHILDSIRDASGFEPIAFLKMDRKGQMEVLRKIVHVDIDLDAVDGQITTLMEERRVHKPTVGPLEDRVFKLRPLIDPDLDVTPVSTAPMISVLEQASAHNATIDQERRRRDDQAHHARSSRVQAEQLRAQARVLLEQAEGMEAAATKYERELAELPPIAEPIDIAGIKGELAAVEAEKAKRETQVRYRDEHAAAYGAHKEAVAKEEALTLAIEELRYSKRAAIARAKMPVVGLSFGDEGVTFNDLPLDHASQAEAIRVAVGIWIAQNPVLRILCVRDASLLDDSSLTVIEHMAEEYDFQVWLEIVSETPQKLGVHMRAGEVVAIDGQPVHSHVAV